MKKLEFISQGMSMRASPIKLIPIIFACEIVLKVKQVCENFGSI